MLKKSILLIGIVMILLVSIVFARGGGIACPYYQTSFYYNPLGWFYDENFKDVVNHKRDYNYYSYDTNIMIFNTTEVDYPIFKYVMIFNYTSLPKDIAKKENIFGFANTNQEDMNIFFLKKMQSKGYCEGYNFGKVTYHEKAIAGTHWY